MKTKEDLVNWINSEIGRHHASTIISEYKYELASQVIHNLSNLYWLLLFLAHLDRKTLLKYSVDSMILIQNKMTLHNADHKESLVYNTSKLIETLSDPNLSPKDAAFYALEVTKNVDIACDLIGITSINTYRLGTLRKLVSTAFEKIYEKKHRCKFVFDEVVFSLHDPKFIYEKCKTCGKRQEAPDAYYTYASEIDKAYEKATCKICGYLHDNQDVDVVLTCVKDLAVKVKDLQKRLDNAKIEL